MMNLVNVFNSIKNKTKKWGFKTKLFIPISFIIIVALYSIHNGIFSLNSYKNNYNGNETPASLAVNLVLLNEKIQNISKYKITTEDLKSTQQKLKEISLVTKGSGRITLNRLDVFLDEIKKIKDNDLLRKKIIENKSIFNELEKLKNEKEQIAIRFEKDSISLADDNLWVLNFMKFFIPISLIMLLFVMIKRIVGPLEEMANFVSLVTKEGHYNYRSEYNHEAQLGVLENCVNEMLFQMSIKDSNMKALLDGLYESVFFFDRTNQISEERSKSVTRIFKGSENVHDMVTFLQKYFGLDEIQSKEILELVWDSNRILDFESTMEIFPQRLSENEGTQSELQVNLNYVDQYDSQGNLQKVIVIGQDITKEIKNERENKKQMNRSRRVQMISGDIFSYREFVQEIQKIIINIDELLTYPDEEKIVLLKRYVHTFKGTASLFEFSEVADLLHKMENVINDLGPKHGLRSMRELFQESLDVFNYERKYVENILRIDKLDEMVSFPKDRFEELKSTIIKYNSNKLNQKLLGLSLTPLNVVLRKYKKFLKRLTDRDENKQVELISHPSSCEVYPEEMNELDVVFTHILRNCYDHGIESVIERENHGKTHSGKINVKTGRNHENKTLWVEISDDGRGINYDKLAQKAIDKGLWNLQKLENASTEEKIFLIFESGVSSKDEVTDISGRGVGMDAVKDFVENQLCGEIKVATTKGKGSTFFISVPDHVTEKVLQVN